MIGKIIKMNQDGSGKLCWSAEGHMYNFTKENILGTVENGDRVYFELQSGKIKFLMKDK